MSKLRGSRINSPDFQLESHGSIFLLRPASHSARRWVEKNIGQDNGYQPHWPTVVVEHRYVADILEGLRASGMVLR
jgi:hypothetical protein